MDKEELLGAINKCFNDECVLNLVKEYNKSKIYDSIILIVLIVVLAIIGTILIPRYIKFKNLLYE